MTKRHYFNRWQQCYVFHGCTDTLTCDAALVIYWTRLLIHRGHGWDRSHPCLWFQECGQVDVHPHPHQYVTKSVSSHLYILNIYWYFVIVLYLYTRFVFIVHPFYHDLVLLWSLRAISLVIPSLYLFVVLNCNLLHPFILFYCLFSRENAQYLYCTSSS